MKCTIDTGLPAAVVTVTGELDLAGAAALRATILKCLAAQPQAVMIDAQGLVVTDDIHLTVLTVAAHHAAAWPSIPVMLCAPSPAVASAAHRLGIDRQVIICSSVDEGHRRAAQRVLPPRVSDSYLPSPQAVPRARNLVLDTCRTWRLPGTAAIAEMVVAELVANAVRHAGTRFDLVMSRSVRNLNVAVRDRCPEPARLVGPDSEAAPHGRGLILVEALATHWGCTPTVDGKVTWAALRAF